MDHPRPTDVFVQKADGSKIPCELTFAGVEGGIAVWDSMTLVEPEDHILIGVLPAKTSLRFPHRLNTHYEDEFCPHGVPWADYCRICEQEMP